MSSETAALHWRDVEELAAQHVRDIGFADAMVTLSATVENPAKTTGEN